MVLRAIGYWIWSNQRGAWWRAGSDGYTDSLESAGIYSHADAAKIFEQANLTVKDGHTMNEYAIPVNAWNGK